MRTIPSDVVTAHANTSLPPTKYRLSKTLAGSAYHPDCGGIVRPAGERGATDPGAGSGEVIVRLWCGAKRIHPGIVSPSSRLRGRDMNLCWIGLPLPPEHWQPQPSG